jgi:hypothetical protein
MRNIIAFVLSATLYLPITDQAQAQASLKSYEDKDGYIDVQKLTCAQLAGTYQEDADFLSVWYSGWYNGLGKKHLINVDRTKEIEHRVIVYCKENQSKKVIQAIDIVFNEMRKAKGIKVE